MNTANTKTKGPTEDSNIDKLVPDNMKSLEELSKEYVKHPNGAIFHVLAHPRKAGKVYLHAKNRYQEYDYAKLRTGLVKGDWHSINIHELKKHLNSEEKFNTKLAQLLVKRTILCQIMLELDDELKEYYADDNYLKGILQRSEKVFERIAKEEYTKLYNVNKEVLNTFFDSLNSFVGKASKLGVYDFVHADSMLELYLSNPEKYQADFVEIEKVE
ncbi:MAG: hypothetical protein KG003_10035 [Bacteroidetes bacterium]|nr:hypothetical protein [Bacteroidota bacterium]